MGLQIGNGAPDWEWDSRLGMGLQIGNGTPGWEWDSRLGIESWVGNYKGKRRVTPVGDLRLNSPCLACYITRAKLLNRDSLSKVCNYSCLYAASV